MCLRPIEMAQVVNCDAVPVNMVKATASLNEARLQRLMRKRLKAFASGNKGVERVNEVTLAWIA
jgi:inorganic pyrophosphatase/exopolyphosphatase